LNDNSLKKAIGLGDLKGLKEY